MTNKQTDQSPVLAGVVDADYPSLFDRTGDVKDINTVLVPRLVLRAALAVSPSIQRAPVEGEPVEEVTSCCGRSECGGECGNEWDGMVPAAQEKDISNAELRAAMRTLMARLANLLDEDQFAECEGIVQAVGVFPDAAAPQSAPSLPASEAEAAVPAEPRGLSAALQKIASQTPVFQESVLGHDLWRCAHCKSTWSAGLASHHLPDCAFVIALDALAATPAQQTQSDAVAGAVKFAQYLKECDDLAIVPDVAGAFHWAFTQANCVGYAVATPPQQAAPTMADALAAGDGTLALSDAVEAIRDVIDTLEQYHPPSDAYKGKYIHKGLAAKLRTALKEANHGV